MSISTALKARQEALRDDREAGFTLIELLVVVIIIGILAAIAIPVYLGVQNNAKDSAVKSDLTNAKTAIVSAATDSNGTLPSSITPGSQTSVGGVATVTGITGGVNLVDKGWSVSTNTTSLAYTAGTIASGASGPTTWCLLGTSSTGTKFVITSTLPVATTSASSCTAS